MTILVCGPERSGTSPLCGFLTAAGLDVEHRSYPEGGWWPPAGDYAHVVALTRWMPDVITAQVRRRFQADERAARSHIGLARRLIAEQYADHPATPRSPTRRSPASGPGTTWRCCSAPPTCRPLRRSAPLSGGPWVCL